MATTDASAVSSSSATAAAAADKATKTRAGKQHKQDEQIRCRSLFDVSQDFFDSCLLLKYPSSCLRDSDISHLSSRSSEDEELGLESKEKLMDNDFAGVPICSNVDNSSNLKSMQRWSCNTCKAEFESLQDQRFHFKSDLHRFNIKLSISGKHIIREEDFDETTSESLCKDFDISSISGSEDEDERENGVVDRRSGNSGVLKSKIYMQLQTGERVSVWRCLVLIESENFSFENDQKLDINGGGGLLHLSHKQVVEKLKYIVHEPRDNTCLRIVLLARGGHFAGCVFNGNSLVVHKTFHRYVVRAKAGKKQSSKDASGRGIHSAGASLRRYNEFALKKNVQELLASWKPYFAVASCIFIHAPSNNRQLLFDGEKPYFVCLHNAIRNIPMTVRRPTFKEARRVYGLLTQITYEITEETAHSTQEDPLSGVSIGNDCCNFVSNSTESKVNLVGTDISEALAVLKEINGSSVSLETKNEDVNIDGLSQSLEAKNENNNIGRSTPLHEAAKSGSSQKVLELLEHGLDPCIRDERGQTPYILASEKEVRNTFRRFMALNLEKWDWQAAQVPSALTKEMEEAQAAKQAEKDAKKKAKAKELKKLRKAREKKAQAEAAQSQNTAVTLKNFVGQSSGSATVSKEEELKRIQALEREKRAAAAERRIAAATASEAPATPNTGSTAAPTGTEILCSCCNISLAGKVPFHRYHYRTDTVDTFCEHLCGHLMMWQHHEVPHHENEKVL
ncbi:ankyrin repeat and zinc finger domain-containing protein 1-like [Dorcoceras hygrometricum]|uniref:Ankyrin repeat and zinc finger domain-containing protein 1-like n=1 Tax=Dorcoceras hygrometricum TaxID=472368 RepID=A0A2Z7CAZ5_9LAMI|nr:ankyrin repeat and zinc finger domain-containing protein 1-like [Dorcoceras hygrometricum]